MRRRWPAGERDTSVHRTDHAARHALHCSPFLMGISSNDFHGAKILFPTNFLLLYGGRDWEQKYYYHEERGVWGMRMSSDRLHISRSSSTTYHQTAGHALLGRPFRMGISSDDFYGAKIIVFTDVLMLYGVRDWEQSSLE